MTTRYERGKTKDQITSSVKVARLLKIQRENELLCLPLPPQPSEQNSNENGLDHFGATPAQGRGDVMHTTRLISAGFLSKIFITPY